MSLLDVFFSLADCHGIKVTLVGLAEVDRDFLYSRENYEHVGLEVKGKACTGAVLVDNGSHTGVVARLVLDDGNAATTHGDNHCVSVNKVLNHGKFHNLHRSGRGHHAAPSASGIFNKGVVGRCHDGFGFFFAVEHAHGFGGVLESGVVVVDHHLRYERDARFVDAAANQFATHCLLQVITNVALSHGATLGEGDARCATAILGRELECQVHHAHLRAIAVTDNHIVALLNEVYDGGSGSLDELELLFGRIAQGVSAQGNYKSFVHIDGMNIKV